MSDRSTSVRLYVSLALLIGAIACLIYVILSLPTAIDIQNLPRSDAHMAVLRVAWMASNVALILGGITVLCIPFLRRYFINTLTVVSLIATYLFSKYLIQLIPPKG